MLELKDTKKNKTHNIQPQHALGGTRVSGSFSNWSVSGDSYSGTSDASSWYGSSRPVRARLDASDDDEVRQRRHASWFSATLTRLARGDVELRLFGSLATSSRLFTSITEQRMHSKRLEALSDVPSSSDRFDSVSTEVDCSVRTQLSNCAVR